MILETVDDGQCQARFRADWGGIFSFEQTVLLEVREDDGVRRFEGAADLGWYFGLGGIFEYRGQVEGDRFEAVYESESDHGTFSMRRLGLSIEGS